MGQENLDKRIYEIIEVAIKVLSQTNAGQPEVRWVLPIAKAEDKIFKLQKRLFKAKLEGRKRVIKFVSRLISKSYYAFILAFERVVRKNTGKKTAGVDKIKLKYNQEDFEYTYERFYLPFILTGIKKYKPKPLRRIDIPKPDGTKRHLGIPTHWDRIYQAMLNYIIETLAEADIYANDLNSFGFRRNIKTADAINALGVLARHGKNTIVIEADIEKCFDRISHNFIMKALKTEHIPEKICKDIQKMLDAGFIDLTGFHETEMGTPQGGIISPALANLVLRKVIDIPGAEAKYKGIKTINLVTYADDLIITITPNHTNSVKPETLYKSVKEIINNLRENLKVAGLNLKDSKSSILWNGWNVGKITYTYTPPPIELTEVEKLLIKFGINKDPNSPKTITTDDWGSEIGIRTNEEKTLDFLGFQLGIGTGIRPAKKKLKNFLEKVNGLIKKGSGIKSTINPVIRGFYNYYAYFSSGIMCKDLGKCDWYIGRQIWKRTGRNGKYTPRDLKNLTTYADIRKTTKYISVKKGASFLSESKDYWDKRKTKSIPARKKNLWYKQDKNCPICKSSITLQDIAEERIESHHVQPKGQGGKDKNHNVILIHQECHRKIHNS